MKRIVSIIALALFTTLAFAQKKPTKLAPKKAAVAPAPVDPPAPADSLKPSEPPPPDTPQTFTVGVTDYTFNPTNAIFGRLLHTADNHVITLAYWNQQEDSSHDEVPYYEKS